MTPKQEAFAREYMIDRNATQAAMRAGYQWPTSQSGFYVYFLIDGRNDEIFYVGKGTRNRITNHRRDAKRSETSNQVKAGRIIECGGHLRETVFADGLDEVAALAMEKSLIKRLRGHGLTNIASGSVHPLESELARIESNMASIRPFSDWVLNASARQLESASKLMGTPEAFYIYFVDTLDRLRADAITRLNLIKGKSNAQSRG